MSQPPYPPESPAGYNQPYYPAYATPPQQQGPTAPKVIGIVGTILGSLGVLSLLAGVILAVVLATVPAFAKGYNRTAGAANTPLAWGMSAVLGLTWIVELAAAIGVLRRAEWGRALLVGWAVVYPVLLLATTAVSVVVLIPRTIAQTPAPPNLPPGFVAAMAYGGAIVGVVLRLVFPPFVLVYLRRPAIRAWFA